MPNGEAEVGPWTGEIPSCDGVASPAPASYLKSGPNGGPGPAAGACVDSI
jgi:hypothetical protein